jgi:hypothetical protein
MIKFNILLVSLVVAFNSCSDKKTFNNVTNQRYLTFKSQFDSTLVNHFPSVLNSSDNLTVSNTNSEKNDVGLFLYEYNLSSNSIKDLEKKIIQQNKSVYNNKDLCLLIVNRFETVRTKDSLEMVEIRDSSLVDKPCYKKLLPIPNFIDFSIANNIDFWKDENFKIYVLNAEAGNFYKKFDLQPNPQMPKEWGNGFSKGVAINKVKNTVIYWSIIW